MGVAGPQLDGFEAFEAQAFQPPAHLVARLVAEGVPQGHPEEIGDPLLRAVPGPLQAVLGIDYYYEEADQGRFTPIVRHVVIERVTAKRAQYALNLRGFAHAPIRDVSLIDCAFDDVAKPNVVEHVEGLSLRNVRINGKPS